jgi:uncharacterized protein YbjT (DUF2867 family)
METSTVLVAGATGFLGTEICRQLRAKNFPVKVMVRSTADPVKTEQLTKFGFQVVQGDLLNKETIYKVLQGVATVITTVSSMPFSYKPGENDIQLVDENGMINLIDASKSAGVNHFIYTSIASSFDIGFPLSNAKRKVEKYLQKSSLTYTILRASCFMEVWLSAAVGFDAMNGKVNICGTGTNPLSYISIKDVAEFAIESISNPFLKNIAIDLGGPQNISQLDAVKIFEEVLQKKIHVQHIPVDALQAQFNSSIDPVQKSIFGLMLCVAKGGRIDMQDVLRRFNIELTSVNDFVYSLADTKLPVF